MSNLKNLLLFSLVLLTSFGSLRAQWRTFATISTTDTTHSPYITDFEFLNNELYIAGYFDFVDGVYAPNIARFDGSNWHPLPINIEFIDDLKTFKNKLYIAGYTGIQGSQQVSQEYVTTWDGQNWGVLLDSALIDNGMNQPIVRKMEVYKDHLFIAGKLYGNKQFPNEFGLAIWDGSQFIEDSIDMSGDVWDMEASNISLGIAGQFIIDSSGWAKIALFDFTNTQVLFPQNSSQLAKGIIHKDNFTYIAVANENLYESGTWSSIDFLKSSVDNHSFHNSKVIFGSLGRLFMADTSSLNSRYLLEDNFGFNYLWMTKYNDSLIVGPSRPSFKGSVDLLIMNLNQLVSLDPLENFNQGFSIYPNPNIGTFNIETTENFKLEIFNLLGENIEFELSKEGNSVNKIQIIKPKRGIYFTKNMINGRTKKVIIQ